MSKKILVSSAMEGKLQAEGLQSMDDGDDLLTAMARELVTRQGVGEQADQVWRSIHKDRRPQAAPVMPTVQVDDEPAPATLWLPRPATKAGTVVFAVLRMSLIILNPKCPPCGSTLFGLPIDRVLSAQGIVV
jgi:hypothetical protein